MKEEEKITILIEPEIKEMVEIIFERSGLTKSEAIELFYQQVALAQAVPFVDRQPNQTTIAALEELKSQEKLSTYSSFGELRQELGI
jgi:addiction module RelB/DinJ family antitoxin